MQICGKKVAVNCWVKYANYCPVEYINKYSGQVGILHLKDFVASKFASGTEYVIVEQDDWYDGDALEIAKTSREYLNNTFDI